MGYGESLVPGTPTISFLRENYGIAEPINAVTALFITYCALNSSVNSRELQWARAYIAFNGLASCFMHSTLPTSKDSHFKRTLANMDGTSMLGAVFAGFSALVDSPALPVEFSLIPFMFVAALEMTESEWFEFSFGCLWAVVNIWTFFIIEEALFWTQARICAGIIFAAACQIIDKQELKYGEKLGLLRQTIPLHAIWHIVAGLMVSEQLELLDYTLT